MLPQSHTSEEPTDPLLNPFIRYSLQAVAELAPIRPLAAPPTAYQQVAPQKQGLAASEQPPRPASIQTYV